jgi:hypothetical protein
MVISIVAELGEQITGLGVLLDWNLGPVSFAWRCLMETFEISEYFDQTKECGR